MKGKMSPMIILIIVLAVLLLIAVGFGVTQVASLKSEVNEARLQNEELQLQNEQLQLTNDVDMLNADKLVSTSSRTRSRLLKAFSAIILPRLTR